ncbi:MAG TPA: RNA polymerase factor sigma-54 [Cycloclasticus sp.]|jgi:RNA polymerase sigma-54 factor|nr:RNA polymerase factor sigma-54 [Cycloclasticus sp.]HIL91574.1 RNA polymerase factor sigma-54 [Cycloclasticus sp.]
MRQSLQLRIGQHLTMTPQLQQAIRLLQLSTVELQQEIQTVLDSNMMLEIPDEESNSAEDNSTNDTASNDEKTSEGSQDQLPDELAVDTSWDEIYDLAPSPGLSQSTDTVTPDPGSINSAKQTLHDHLMWQMELTNFSDTDRAIATAIIDSIDDNGYLKSSIEALHLHLSEQIEELELDEVIAVLHKVQTFDPLGVAALDLQDCLLIQLKQLPEHTPLLALTIELVSEHMPALGSQDSAKLKRQLGIDDETLSGIITLIQSLNPRPGSGVDESSAEYITPDVYVIKTKNKWQVSINGEVATNIRINPLYQALIKRGDKSADSQTMKNHLQEARWFLKSLQSRNDTLLLVSQEIVNRQQDFLEHGAIAMKPMVLRDIAETVEMHESTISRVTTNKYLHTPNGIFELKHFFSSHVSTDSGGECSATAIRAFIKELVDSESSKKPLSDNKIAIILSDKGINVARRTIAKYRESISIPPSSQRKRIL